MPHATNLIRVSACTVAMADTNAAGDGAAAASGSSSSSSSDKPKAKAEFFVKSEGWWRELIRYIWTSITAHM